MTLLFIRIFFVIISGIIGYQIGAINQAPLTGVFVCMAGAGFFIFVEANLKQVSVRGLSSMVFGLLLGIFMANLVSDIISLLPLGDVLKPILRVVMTLVFSYLGAVMALRGKDEFNLIIPYVRFKRQDLKDGVIL